MNRDGPCDSHEGAENRETGNTSERGMKRGTKAAMISVLLAPTVRHLSLSRPLITPPFCHCG